jgi:NleD-like pathogen effector protein (putative zinc metallopeptidase)
MAVKVQDKLSLFTGHIGRALFKVAPTPDGETEQDIWQKETAEALDQIRRNKHGAGLLKETEESMNEVQILKAAEPENLYNSTWVEGTPPGMMYDSLRSASSLTKTSKAALAHGCPSEKLFSLVAKYGIGIWNPADCSAQDWNLNEIGDQLLKCELENYDCLTPGKGVSCFIRWNPNNDFVGNKAKLDANALENRWRIRPPWIGLAHELIHAWRYLTGRCIFSNRSNSEQPKLAESLTVGLLPVDQGKYTENGIRNDTRQIARAIYGSDHGP